jgi:hypothetical protein
MRSITRLAPRDPADEMARHIGTKVNEHLFKKKLEEVTEALQLKAQIKQMEKAMKHA